MTGKERFMAGKAQVMTVSAPDSAGGLYLTVKWMDAGKLHTANIYVTEREYQDVLRLRRRQQENRGGR